MSVQYRLDGDAVLRETDGQIEELALYDAETKSLTVPADKSSFKSRIIRELNKAGVAIGKVEVLGGAAPDIIPDPAPKTIPPKPLPLRGAGDKTPSIVRWYHENDFPEFKRRYGVKNDQPDGDGLYVARRKTCLTRRVQTGDSGSEYAD